MGLGSIRRDSLAAVGESMAAARNAAEDARRLLQQKRDPIKERDRDRSDATTELKSEDSALGDYLRGRAARRFAGTPRRCLVTGFHVSAASNSCRNPCANCSTAFPKAPSCPTRTIATDRCRSNDGGRNTFTGSIE